MIEVIEGSAQDIDAVMRIMADAFDPDFGEAWTQSQVLASMTFRDVNLVLAKQDAEVTGFAITRTVCDETELLMIAVARKWHGHGFASNIVKHIVKNERRYKRTKIFLEVRENNKARQFYTKHGFVEIGRRANYYIGNNGLRHDAITMAYALL
jgi:ribosomal-protein-alanine N-acetyltransferase